MDSKKYRKLINTPLQFFYDALKNRFNNKNKIHKFDNEKKLFQNHIKDEFISTEKIISKKFFLAVGKQTKNNYINLLKQNNLDIYYLSLLDIKKENFSMENFENFVIEYPLEVKLVLARNLIPLKKHISGLIFFNGSSPFFQLLNNVCEQLGIIRILGTTNINFKKEKNLQWEFILSSGGICTNFWRNSGYHESRVIEVGSIASVIEVGSVAAGELSSTLEIVSLYNLDIGQVEKPNI
jgi:hypothetical protein